MKPIILLAWGYETEESGWWITADPAIARGVRLAMRDRGDEVAFTTFKCVEVGKPKPKARKARKVRRG